MVTTNIGGAFVMPYIVPLFLGMTYDARTSKPGVDIFDGQYVEDAEVIENRQTTSLYKVIDNISDLLNELNLSGDLALRIKSGNLNIDGKGSYLKNNRDTENSVTILTKLNYIGVVKTFKSSAKPRDGWANAFNPDILGTHFVSSVTYGVEIIAAAKFVVNDDVKVSDIKAAVVGTIGLEGNGTSIDADGKFHKLTEDLKSKARLEISYYGTLPIKTVPNSIDELKKLIATFGDQVKEANLTHGIPMAVSLVPLTDIAPPEDDPKFKFDANAGLMVQLPGLDSNLDDLVSSRLKLEDFAKSLPFDINEDARNRIGSLLKNITDILQTHYKTISALNVTQGPDQLQAAFNAYGNPIGMRKYLRLAEKLISDISKEVDKDAYVSTDTYIHWGNVTCPGDKTKLLYKGFTFSSSEDGIGGSSQYNCAPEDLMTSGDLKHRPRSMLSAIRYSKFSKDGNPFKGIYARNVSGSGVPCAKCFSPNTASITMFSAKNTCPQTWALLYKGYLMSSRRNGFTTEYICVDEMPSKPFVYNYPRTASNILALTVIKSKGALPSDKFMENALVECVVCGKESPNTL